MEAPESANTETNYDHMESTIQPEETQPEAEEADISLERSSPEQPLDMPKPKRKGRPLGTKDAYKRTRKSNTTNTPTSVAAPMPAMSLERSFPHENAAVDRYDQPMGVDMNTRADLMLDRMTVRASGARALRTHRWDTCMPHR